MVTHLLEVKVPNHWECTPWCFLSSKSEKKGKVSENEIQHNSIRNTMQYHTIIVNTMQYFTSLVSLVPYASSSRFGAVFVFVFEMFLPCPLCILACRWFPVLSGSCRIPTLFLSDPYKSCPQPIKWVFSSSWRQKMCFRNQNHLDGSFSQACPFQSSKLSV